MFGIGFYINAVACFHYLLLSVYRKLEHSACHIGGLRVVMRMRSARRPFLKLHFDQHDLSVIPHDLPYYPFACRFPGDFFFMQKRFASCFHIGFLN